MKIFIDKSFVKDVDQVRDRKVLNKLSSLLKELENSKTLTELPHVKKNQGIRFFLQN